MAVLLLADVNGDQLATDAVAKALTGVKGLGEVHLLVAGPA
jgi:electron transfer flavoprotein alpha subunit